MPALWVLTEDFKGIRSSGKTQQQFVASEINGYFPVHGFEHGLEPGCL